MFMNVAPPSSLLYGVTPSSQTRLSVDGSMNGLEKYIGRGLLRPASFHVAPPSSVRYVPLAVACSMSAIRTLGLDCEMASAMRPLSPVGIPFSSLAKCAPASVDFQIALPGPPPLKPKALRRRWYVAAYTTLGS